MDENEPKNEKRSETGKKGADTRWDDNRMGRDAVVPEGDDMKGRPKDEERDEMPARQDPSERGGPREQPAEAGRKGTDTRNRQR